MRRIGRHRRKKLNKIIVLSAFCLLFVITAGYAAFSTNISLHVKGNLLEGTRVIQEWDENSETDFHSDYYKQNIVNITFLNNNNVPDNAVESWNVSEDKEKGTVKAWVVPNSEDSSKYDLYIGAKGKVIANENSGYVFYDFRGVKEINFDNNFDTSNATNMAWMFRLCTSLETINLSSLDTSNVTDMNSLFNMWDSNVGGFMPNKLSSITFGGLFNTSNVINMKNMFAGFQSMSKLDLSTFDTSNVVNMNHMFNHCISLKVLNISSFNTSKVTDMVGMFQNCTGLTELDLSSFNTQNVIDMSVMFSMWDDNENGKCLDSSLNKLDISSFNTSNVISMNSMFACNNVSEIKGLENFNTSNVINMHHMFLYCKNISELNLCSFDTQNVTDMESMLSEMPSLTKVYVGSNWVTYNANIKNLLSNSGVSSVTTGQCG